MKPFKVKITKSSPWQWYANRIGEVFTVIDVNVNDPIVYSAPCQGNYGKDIDKGDCEIVSPAHKHARVIIAIAEGKSVQYACPSTDYCWVDYEVGDVNNPLFQFHWDWRIKPEHKPDVVRYMHLPSTEAITQPTYCRDIEYGNLKLTFDGETGELKDVQRY